MTQIKQAADDTDDADKKLAAEQRGMTQINKPPMTQMTQMRFGS